MYAFEKDQRRATALLKRLKDLTGFQQSRGSKDGEVKKIKQKHLGGRWGGVQWHLVVYEGDGIFRVFHLIEIIKMSQ